jgi:hypothetical protein
VLCVLKFSQKSELLFPFTNIIQYVYVYIYIYIYIYKGLRWSRGSVLAFSAEAVGFLRAKKILSTPSFGGEVDLRHVKDP